MHQNHSIFPTHSTFNYSIVNKTEAIRYSENISGRAIVSINSFAFVYACVCALVAADIFAAAQSRYPQRSRP